MSLLGVLGAILLVLGVLGLLHVLAFTLTVALLLCIAGVVLVCFFGYGYRSRL